MITRESCEMQILVQSEVVMLRMVVWGPQFE